MSTALRQILMFLLFWLSLGLTTVEWRPVMARLRQIFLGEEEAR